MMTTATSVSDPFSPRSSVGSGSTDTSSLPRRRIRCSKTQISVGDCRYESATDALQAYLQQFEETSGDGASDKDDKAITPRNQSAGSSSQRTNGLVNGADPAVVSSKPPLASSLVAGGSRQAKETDVEGRGTGPGKLMGKGLAGSGLVLGSNGIAVAGTREDVEDLLTSKVTPQLQEEVTDTLREVKLRRLLKQAALKSKNQTKTGLQQEVEAALIRSAELLEKVTREDIPTTKAAAVDITSVNSPNSSTLNTELEALLLGNTSLLGDADHTRLEGQEEEGDDGEGKLSDSLPSTPRRSGGHTYSYHTSRPSRSKQRQDENASLTDSQLTGSSRCAPVSYAARSRYGRRHRASSIDSLLPTPSVSLNSTLQLLLNPKDYANKRDALCSPESSDSAPSNQSDPTDLLRQIRSRSVSPGVFNGGRNRRGQRSPRTESAPRAGPGSLREAPDWVQQLDDSVKKSVPNWVGEMNSSQVSDSVWLHEALLQDENNKRPSATAVSNASKIPSWVGQAEESDVNDEEEGEGGSLLSDTSRPALVPLMSTPIRPMVTSNNRDWDFNPSNRDSIVSAGKHSLANNITDLTNDSRPGLNYSDLNTSSPHTTNDNHNNNINTSNTSNKHVTFTDSTTEYPERPSSTLPVPQRPATASSLLSPSTSLLRKSKGADASSPVPSTLGDKVVSGRVTSPIKADLSSPAPSRVLDSEYNGEAILRNSILPQTVRLRRSMDTFAASSENLRRRSVSSSGSSEGSVGASGVTTRCSSLDTVALLSGKPLTRSHRQVLNGDSGGASGDDGAGRGVDLESSSDGLDGDRPWERMVNTIKAPVPVGTELNGIETSNGHVSHQLENTLSGGRQPGSMEALKNMLFKLQAEETSTQDTTDQRGEDVLNTSGQNMYQPSLAVIPALENYDFKQEPGGHSLEKALVHLNRLKKLVKTTPTSASAASEGEIKTTATAANGSSNKIS